ncbi:MAG: ATP-grasp domain-containing protein [Firmicutes bacterium]|nr:ATP-grasp domain-containing protein [Bacillota bacterium]
MSARPSRRLLLLASKLGYQTRRFAETARGLGVEVIFGTDRCHRLDDPWCDAALPVPFERPAEAVARLLEAFNVQRPDGLLALGDRPVLTAALLAERLGLPGNPPAAAEICRSKLRQREALRAAGLRVPEFASFPLEQDATVISRLVRYPCVVKPLVLAASQGVMRANDPEEFVTAARRLQRLLESPEIAVLREPESRYLLVEDYIPGREVAVEGLLSAGRLRVLAIFDKPDPMEGPYFEETIYVTPTRLPEHAQQALLDCCERTVRALGLFHGPLHAEFRINDSGVWPIEAAPRPIGGLCARTLRFGPERIYLEELLVRHALGLPGSELPRESDAAGVMMIPVPRSGLLENVDGEQAARAVAGVEDLQITARLHDYIAAWPEGSSYLGFIFARGARPELVEAALREAHARLQFRIVPRLPVEHPASGRLPARAE